MSKLKKTLISVVLLIISIVVFCTVSNALYKPGERVKLTYENWIFNSRILCVEHEQRLWSEGRMYTVVNNVHIEGKKAKDYKGTEIESKENAKLAYILSKATGVGSRYNKEYSDVQNAIWDYMPTWIKKVGDKFVGISVGFASNSPGIAGRGTKLLKEADNYANNLNDGSINNKTDESKIKVEAYKNNNETDLKIGPFSFEFGGNLTKIELSDTTQNKTITPKSYVVYSGTKLKAVELNKIKSGEKFYAIIPSNSGIGVINNIKATASQNVKVADISFLKCDDGVWQNLIQYEHSEKPVNTDLNWDVKIPLLINISGFVWEDTLGGKNNSYVTYGENIYKEGDVLVEGITVRLKDQNGNVVKNNDGNDAVTTTNAQGEYKFTNLLIANLADYWVEFEYDGLKYTTVKPLVGNDQKINAKASEVVEQRKELNTAFTEITNKGNISDREHGYSRNGNGNVTGELTYKNNTNEWYSTFESTTYNKNLSANTKITNYSINEQFKNGNYEVNDDGAVEIKYINAGLVKREQPQMSISNDIESVEVDVNGYSHLYEYKQRKEAIENNTAFNVGVKFGKEYTSGYYRAIYPSDIQYSATASSDNKLKVYVTYSTTIRNLSTELKMSLNELANYYDKEYEIVDSWIGDNEKNKVEWHKLPESSKYDDQKYDDGKYKGAYTTSLAGTKIDAQKNIKIYVKFQVSEGAVLGLLNEKATLNNTLEVFSYSTYYGSDKEECKTGDIYAGIDRASAPGNAKPGDKTTYEADTDDAPSLLLEAKGVRTIEGNVFEDSTEKEDLQTGKERRGDGIYKDGENSIRGVEVSLLYADGAKAGKPNDVANIYPNITDENGNVIADIHAETAPAKMITGADGHYIFRGIEPDKYFIKYTYSNGETKVFDTEGKEVKDINVQDYKSTIITSDTIKNAFEENESHLTWYKEDNKTRYSDARDNYDIRQKIDEKLKAIDATTEPTIKSLDANTPKFDLGIEYDTTYTESTGDFYEYKISNIDFGIVRRPMQSAELDKVISNIKVTLPNGQLLVDGDPRKGNLNYVTVTDDTIYITIDSELLYGSQVELKYDLKVTNTSELDYLSRDYYYYGIKEGDKVKFTRAALIDYVDKELTLKAGQDGDWQVFGNAEALAEKGYNWNLTEEEEQKLLNNFSVIVKAEPVSETESIEPGNSKISSIIVEKLLSESNEMSFDNNGEVVTIEKNGGSNITTKLGSYAKVLAANPDAEPVETDEDKAQTTTIIPPTGATNNNVLYAIIGVISLAVLGTGTYGVRRFLKK